MNTPAVAIETTRIAISASMRKAPCARAASRPPRTRAHAREGSDTGTVLADGPAVGRAGPARRNGKRRLRARLVDRIDERRHALGGDSGCRDGERRRGGLALDSERVGSAR